MESSLEPEPAEGLYAVAHALVGIPATAYPLVGVTLLLLCISALVSGSEVAFFSLTPGQISHCKQARKPADVLILDLLSNPKLLLATILILNNLVNVAIVTLSTFITWQIAGKDNHLALALLTVLVTVAIVFFGEIVPKVFATQRNMSFAVLTSRPLYICSMLFRPLSGLLTHLGNFVEKRFHAKGYEVSVNEIKEALEMTTRHEASEGEKEILKGIVNFGSKLVKQIMRSRMDITAFDIELDFHQLMDLVNKSGYSRIPIYSETIDQLEGILYIKDILPYLDRDEYFEWQKLIRRDIFFVIEGKKIDQLLREFQEKRVHIAIVVDEYGGTLGLVTLEDVVEEIMGEINDELDTDEISYKKIDEHTFTFEGKTSLNDFCKILDIDIHTFDAVKGESESLGGLFLEIASHMPLAGEKVEFGNYVFTAVSVTRKRIKTVRVLIREQQNKHHSSDFLD